jgi:ubiquinone/menaquinone biosynthesis C-methylase UbiE/uncharacterized protein YbaR (Trm112 family)
MKESLLNYIVCPVCSAGFKLINPVQDAGEITSASLVCSKGHSFPVTGGIPRLLSQDELSEAQKETQDSFGQKWSRIPDYGYEAKTKEFHLNWYLQRYGWGNLVSLIDFLSTKQFILDAGTGLGRDVKLYAEHTKGQVFGVDISRSIDIAYQHIGHLPNVHFIQGDLTNLPFAKGFFDYIASDGVLHHTPSTENSFKSLVPCLEANGDIAIYVYKKKGPVREFCDDYIRNHATNLSAEACYDFSKAVTRLGKSLSDMNAEISIPEDIPYLELKAGKHNLQRFIYWNMFKCFWKDDYDFETNVMVNFDWYHPQYAHRHMPEEVRQWFQDMNLDILHFDVIESGISARGRKCAA